MTEIGNQEGKKDKIRAQAQHETTSSRKSSSENWEWGRESIVRNWWGWFIKVITDDDFPDLLEKSFAWRGPPGNLARQRSPTTRP